MCMYVYPVHRAVPQRAGEASVSTFMPCPSNSRDSSWNVSTSLRDRMLGTEGIIHRDPRDPLNSVYSQSTRTSASGLLANSEVMVQGEISCFTHPSPSRPQPNLHPRWKHHQRRRPALTLRLSHAAGKDGGAKKGLERTEKLPEAPWGLSSTRLEQCHQPATRFPSQVPEVESVGTHPDSTMRGSPIAVTSQRGVCSRGLANLSKQFLSSSSKLL